MFICVGSFVTEQNNLNSNCEWKNHEKYYLKFQFHSFVVVYSLKSEKNNNNHKKDVKILKIKSS